jgi:hypothetical protein
MTSPNNPTGVVVALFRSPTTRLDIYLTATDWEVDPATEALTVKSGDVQVATYPAGQWVGVGLAVARPIEAEMPASVQTLTPEQLAAFGFPTL